jgi:hypothetical protein
MRRVVGRDAVNRAGAQPLDQRLAIGFGAQRRVHLEGRVEAAERLVGERQVVRSRLAGDRDACRLRRFDGGHRLGGREVLNMDAGALIAGKLRVAADHGRL